MKNALGNKDEELEQIIKEKEELQNQLEENKIKMEKMTSNEGIHRIEIKENEVNDNDKKSSEIKHSDKDSKKKFYNNKTDSKSKNNPTENIQINNEAPQKDKFEVPKFDFLILFSSMIEKNLVEKQILRKIEKDLSNCISMDFDHSYSIPEYNGTLLRIKGDSLKEKRDATERLLEFIVNNDIDQPEEDKIVILIMIPNGLVSLIIGTKGKQIVALNKDSNTVIVINHPVYKMTFRSVSITGRPPNIADAIMNIHRILEERYFEIRSGSFNEMDD